MNQSFEETWKYFSQRDHYDLGTLSDEQVPSLARHYMKEGLHQMKSPERMQVFMAEMNERSANRIAKTGKQLAIAATILAGVSLAVGAVQLVVSLKH